MLFKSHKQEYRKFATFDAALSYARTNDRLTHEVEHTSQIHEFSAVEFCEGMFSPDAIDRLDYPESQEWFYRQACVWTWGMDRFLFDREEDAVAFRLWVSA